MNGKVVATALVLGCALIGAATLSDRMPGPVTATVVVVVGLLMALAVIAAAWQATSTKKAQGELAGGNQYRALADEYRRLADLAITAQEHTDLKLGDLGVQLDYLREQNESLQKILREVE
jgi:hypothetical protein